ncbi:MAG: hypothetical protein IPL60_00035 [Ardenticatenia bacterium]|nr:hypothetical protein [Ardenticatenia bacterium]
MSNRPKWFMTVAVVALLWNAIGCMASLGLILRKRWALPLLLFSLLGVVAQDLHFAGRLEAIRQSDSSALPLQGLVLLIAVLLWLLARRANREGWLG